MESVTAAATLGRNPARQNISRGGVTSVFMGSHKYEAIPSFEDEYPARELRYSTDIPENHHVLLEEHLKQPQRKFNRRLIMTGIIALGSVLIYFLVILYVGNNSGFLQLLPIQDVNALFFTRLTNKQRSCQSYAPDM